MHIEFFFCKCLSHCVYMRMLTNIRQLAGLGIIPDMLEAFHPEQLFAEHYCVSCRSAVGRVRGGIDGTHSQTLPSGTKVRKDK